MILHSTNGMLHPDFCSEVDSCHGCHSADDVSHQLFARPAVTFPTAEHRLPLANTKLHRYVTDGDIYEQTA